MKTVFYSDFSKPDDRWATRHVASGNAADKCSVTQGGYMKQLIKPADNPAGFVTGHICTPNYTFTYGLAEARMRFGSPKGAHSAFWLQPAENAYLADNSKTPANERETEIDIIEHFGDDSLHHNIYWSLEGAHPGDYQNKHKKVDGYDPSAWHTYGCRWQASSYQFFIDGKKTATFKKGTSTTPKMLLLSILVSDWEEPKLQRDHLEKYKTEIDWVRVKQ